MLLEDRLDFSCVLLPLRASGYGAFPTWGFGVLANKSAGRSPQGKEFKRSITMNGQSGRPDKAQRTHQDLTGNIEDTD